MQFDTDRHQPRLYNIVMNTPFIIQQDVDAMSTINLRTLFLFAWVKIDKITANPTGQLTHVDLVSGRRYTTCYG